MLRYGAWLKKEARAGRFHYLTADLVTAKLAAKPKKLRPHRHRRR